MSTIPLRGPDGALREVDTFTRTEGDKTIHTQAVANADPATGTHVPVATEATLQLLASAADAIRAAAETLAGRPAGLTDAQLRAAPVPVDVVGELVEATQALRMCAQTLARTVGASIPDHLGRLRVTVDNASGATLAIVGSLTAFQSWNTGPVVPAMTHLPAQALRSNITVS